MRDHLPAYFRRDPLEPPIRLVGVNDGGLERGQVMAIEPTQQRRVPKLGVPHVEGVAGRAVRKTSASAKSWSGFIEKYGLPAYARWNLPTLEEVRKERCEIPVKILQDVAKRAFLIAYSREAIRGNYGPLKELLKAIYVERSQKWSGFFDGLGKYTTEVLSRHRVSTVELDWAKGMPKTASGYEAFASGTIWVAMNEAFDDLVPVVSVDTEGRPALGFHAKGWWPLMVINALQPRQERGEGGYCKALECPNFVPPGSKQYCSSTCRERAKKQRRAAYRELTEE